MNDIINPTNSLFLGVGLIVITAMGLLLGKRGHTLLADAFDGKEASARGLIGLLLIGFHAIGGGILLLLVGMENSRHDGGVESLFVKTGVLILTTSAVYFYIVSKLIIARNGEVAKATLLIATRSNEAKPTVPTE